MKILIIKGGAIILVVLSTFSILSLTYSQKCIDNRQAVKVMQMIYALECNYKNNTNDEKGNGLYWIGNLNEIFDKTDGFLEVKYSDLLLMELGAAEFNANQIRYHRHYALYKDYYSYFFRTMELERNPTAFDIKNSWRANRFSFIAVPWLFDEGLNTYIVNQDGVIYSKYIMNIFEKDFYIKADLLRWPANPIEEGWNVVVDMRTIR